MKARDCPIGLGETPLICSAGSCPECQAERLATLTRPEPEPEQAKPVAWRYQLEPGRAWHVVGYSNEVPTVGMFPRLVVEPLYDTDPEALAEVERLKRELAEVVRLNAPDASPDDPAVTRLNVHDTVMDWMRAGYRLHQRVGIDAHIQTLTTRAETAEAAAQAWKTNFETQNLYFAKQEAALTASRARVGKLEVGLEDAATALKGIADNLGEAIHTGLRKNCDSRAAHEAWAAINAAPDWQNAVEFALHGLDVRPTADRARALLTEEP